MEENWDKFEPFKCVDKRDFSFQPSRFKIHIGGKVTEEGSTSALLNAKVIEQNGTEKIAIIFKEENLKNKIGTELYFDEFITANDRLQLVTIPNETNSENMGIMMFKKVIGATRPQKDFSPIEPYCCNLFLVNGGISKISFSFSSPDKLIELYKNSNTKHDYEKCFDLTFNQHNISEGKKLALEIIENGDNHIVPFVCLAAIYSTEKNWNECIEICSTGLRYHENPALYNHIGHAYCMLNKISTGVFYFGQGKDLGDESCIKNYNHWLSRM